MNLNRVPFNCKGPGRDAAAVTQSAAIKGRNHRIQVHVAASILIRNSFSADSTGSSRHSAVFDS